MIDGPHMIEAPVAHPDKPDNAWWACEQPERPFDSFVVAWDGCPRCKLHSKVDFVHRSQDPERLKDPAWVFYLFDMWYGADVLPEHRDVPGGPDAPDE